MSATAVPATPAPIALARESLYLAWRGTRGLWRQPAFLGITLTQPVVWLLLFGQLFKRVADLPGFDTASYIAFLTPGIVVMTCLFSTGWAGMAMILDSERGVMSRLLVSPARRGSVIGGNLLYQCLTTVLQSAIIIGLGLATGARFAGGVLVGLVFLVDVLLFGVAFASYSNALALVLRQQESVIGAVNGLVLPLSFLSTTLMPESLLPGWMADIARYNPVNWTVEVGRQLLAEDVDWGLVGIRSGLLAALALVAAWASTRAFRSYQRSV